MGAIRMQLDGSPAHARARSTPTKCRSAASCATAASIQERREGVPRITPNPEMMGVFWMREPRTLYGRQTEVIHHGAKIGDIVEVLPLV